MVFKNLLRLKFENDNRVDHQSRRGKPLKMTKALESLKSLSKTYGEIDQKVKVGEETAYL